jgi:Permuted papain-like amidase enzyme, YaeF/YiiX, C92 family
MPSTAPRRAAPELPRRSLAELQAGLRVGDVVFTRIGVHLFRQVSTATGAWTNHVGVVVDVGPDGPWVAESCIPLSRRTTFAAFVARSERGRVAILRLPHDLAPEQRRQLAAAARRRLGVFYDTGFDLKSRRQFCSRFVHEVMAEATGIALGEVTSFRELHARRPQASLAFWKLWYFGRIPWDRTTITPASLQASAALQVHFDGAVDAPSRRIGCRGRAVAP